jgi:hypothetical protein
MLWVLILQVEEEEVVTGKAEYQITGYKRPVYFYMPDMRELVGWNEIFGLKFEDSLNFVNSFDLPKKPGKKAKKDEIENYYTRMAMYGVGLIRVGLFKDGVNALSKVVDYSFSKPEYPMWLERISSWG